MNSDQIKIQAKKAYECGRFIAAAKYLWFVLPIFLIALCTCGSAELPLIIGCILAISVVALKWRGEEYGFSVGPGLIAGAIAFSIPLILHVLEICCQNNLEVFFCTVSGILGGGILGFLVSKSKRPHKMRALGFAIAVASLTASLGCISLGIGATMGLFSSIAVAGLSIFAFKTRS